MPNFCHQLNYLAEFCFAQYACVNQYIMFRHLCYLHKNSLAVKKVQPCSKWPVWKSCEIKGAAKKWLWWYRLMAKILIATIQVNLCCLIPASLDTKFTWIVAIIIFAINLYHHSQFLAAPCDFTTFSHRPFWAGPHLFSPRLFLCRYYSTSFCNLTCDLRTIDVLYNSDSSWTVYWVTCL